MTRQLENWFLLATAILLFVLASVFLLAAATSHTEMFAQPDPLLFLSRRIVFFVVCALLLGTSAFLLMWREPAACLVILSAVTGNLLTYFVGMAYYGEANLFVCLGNLSEWMPVHPERLNLILLALFGIMLAGSIGLLGWRGIESWRNDPARDAQAAGTPGPLEQVPQQTP